MILGNTKKKVRYGKQGGKKFGTSRFNPRGNSNSHECYNYRKPGHFARECKTMNQVHRQLNMLATGEAAGSIDQDAEDSEWEVVTSLPDQLTVDSIDSDESDGYTDEAEPPLGKGAEDSTLVRPLTPPKSLERLRKKTKRARQQKAYARQPNWNELPSRPLSRVSKEERQQLATIEDAPERTEVVQLLLYYLDYRNQNHAQML